MSRELVREQAMICMWDTFCRGTRVARFLGFVVPFRTQMGYNHGIFNFRTT